MGNDGEREGKLSRLFIYVTTEHQLLDSYVENEIRKAVPFSFTPLRGPAF